MAEKDWITATPSEVELEVRKRLGIEIKSELFVECFDDYGQIADGLVRGVYVNDIAAVLRDVLPRIRGENFDASIGFDWDGSGLLEKEIHHGHDGTSILADWPTLDAAPLAICRAFCQMKETNPEQQQCQKS